MDTFVLAVQVLLAAVFATAGVGKLLDRSGSREALTEFGVPAGLAAFGAVALPVIELATAVALLIPDLARWGAVAACVLLLAFIGGIANALAAGRTPDCHCFGQIQSSPAGWSTLVRNGVLAALAAIVAVYGAGPSYSEWTSDRSNLELVAAGGGALAVILAAACLRLWLTNRELRHQVAHERETTALFPPGLPAGAWAPEVTLRGLDGGTFSLETLLKRGRPVALVFASPGCGPCHGLMPELARWQAPLDSRITIGVVTTGTAADNQRLGELGLEHVGLQDDAEVMEAYRVSATPSAVIVKPDGSIATSAVVGAHAVEPLVRTAIRPADAAAESHAAADAGFGPRPIPST